MKRWKSLGECCHQANRQRSRRRVDQAAWGPKKGKMLNLLMVKTLTPMQKVSYDKLYSVDKQVKKWNKTTQNVDFPVNRQFTTPDGSGSTRPCYPHVGNWHFRWITSHAPENSQRNLVSGWGLQISPTRFLLSLRVVVETRSMANLF